MQPLSSCLKSSADRPILLQSPSSEQPQKATPVQDFAKRYTENPQYRKTAIEELEKFIRDDVSAISLNPVFGSLWRVVCSDRKNPSRDEIITEFGRQVNQIKNADEKDRMKIWLEESYDFTTEAMDTIASVPKEQRFPCVVSASIQHHCSPKRPTTTTRKASQSLPSSEVIFLKSDAPVTTGYFAGLAES
ncbi:hypothetical protein VC83_08411 [Pseudogymnoascus destructans]|uniref:Uncharacterized protein n=2 Tax=Pseudogymnoascus destructans TaxID=655981 RepID=L8FPA2_PSED2|nr:uncharacterized protein VC83_08411 [Pseudogymnoascus destructans]ELR02717.1 hypothetical protein GMDG_05666 [Pseudogymnoascus destructans 20631-21]OAF55208.1 hypothetical protein VC83_08411 [Pseudogymnoascus destructans]